MTAATEQKSQKSDAKHEEFGVLPGGFSAGPLGLGHPDDMRLRKVEREIMIPQKMKEKGKAQNCAAEVKGFADCARGRSISLPFACRSQANKLHECLTTLYADPAFKEECTQEYLKERAEYRRTGIRKKFKKKESEMA